MGLAQGLGYSHGMMSGRRGLKKGSQYSKFKGLSLDTYNRRQMYRLGIKAFRSEGASASKKYAGGPASFQAGLRRGYLGGSRASVRSTTRAANSQVRNFLKLPNGKLAGARPGRGNTPTFRTHDWSPTKRRG